MKSAFPSSCGRQPACISLLVAMLTASAAATPRTWIGPANGDWFTPANWSGSAAPAGGDSVTVASGSILLTNATPSLDSFTITNAVLTFTNWASALQATNITLQNNSRLRHVVSVTNGALTDTNRIHVVCSNLNVQAGAWIDANSSGYTGRFANAGIGPGAGAAPGGTGAYGGGGSYGGRGGQSYYPAGPTYGSASEPVQPGSSGGAGQGTGGNGGGAVWIEASGTVTVAGSIVANGGNGNGDQAAAGSGGGIYISCRTIEGNGSIQANGGNLGGNGGGGGGGRIAVLFDPAAQSLVLPKPPLVFSTAGGSAGAITRYGNMGTLYFPDPTILTLLLSHTGELIIPGFISWAPDSLTFSNGAILFPTGMVIAVTNDLTVASSSTLTLTNTALLSVGGDLLLTNGSSLYLHSPETNSSATYGCRLAVGGDLHIAPNTILYPYAHPTNGGAVQIVARNVTVAAGGQINATGGGFGPRPATQSRGYGPGGGYGNASGGGGGYGGMGGQGNIGHGNNFGGPAYGFADMPYRFVGSGGGSGNQAGGGGRAGALIWIVATNQVTINGTLSANGNAGNGYAGGGSGGAIQIECPVLGSTTSGLIQANGGRHGAESGGGGGGRIALVGWVTNHYDGSFAVIGSTGSYPLASYDDGSNGTVALIQNPGYALTFRVRGAPFRHSVATPYDYGDYALHADTPVTNEIPLTTEQTATMRFICHGWVLTNDVGAVLGSDGNTQAVLTVNTGVVLTWNWTNQYYLATTSAPNGSLLQDVTGWYTNGVQVSVTATAETDYAFLMWSGPGVPDGHSLDNPLLLTMDQARTVQANFVSTAPTPRSWNGVNPWLTATNWTPSGLPGLADLISIQSGTCTVADPTIVGSLTVADGATLLFTNWPSSVSAGTIIVQSNGVITHAACATNVVPGNTNRIRITCADLTVAPGGIIQADGRGYAGGGINAYGQGPGGGMFATSGGGGGHGGAGSSGNPGHGSRGGPSYGSPDAPDSLGSGGGATGAGGAGGGAIHITATQKVTVNGRISANGQGGVSGNSGGGAGGSVFITCDRVAGSGIISADGGASNGEGGAGGGGRVALVYDTASQTLETPRPTFRVSASARPTPYVSVVSEGGTVYLPDSQLFPSQLDSMFPRTNRFVGVAYWAPDSLSMSNATASFMEPGFVLSVTNGVSLAGPSAGLSFTGALVTIGTGLAISNGSSLSFYRHINSQEALVIPGDLRLDGGTLTFFYALTNPLSFSLGGDLVLLNAAKLHAHAGLTNGPVPGYGALVNLSGRDLTIPSNSAVFVSSHPFNGGSIRLTMRNLNIEAGGLLSADSRGYSRGINTHVNGYGPGFGYMGANSGGGAGYGGVGGKGGHANSYPGTTYGSTNMPVSPGSGGGDWRGSSVNAGYGGGLIWVEAEGIVQLDGTVSANGDSPGGYQGGGAGGGIFILCRKLVGTSTGILRTNGGKGGAESGGGGGGRIAVNCVSLQWPFIANATAAGGLRGLIICEDGAPGTVFWTLRPPGGSTLVLR